MDGGSEVAFIFDSDASFQILLCDQQNIFAVLASDFGVRSYVMNEVEIELRSNRKFGALIKPKLDKALKSGLIKILTASDLDRLSANASNPVSLADIRELGADYALDVGKGEAYTHAAGILLESV